MNKYTLLLIAAAAIALPSCVDDNDVDYTEWKNSNSDYFKSMENALNPDGSKEYQLLTPSWAPGAPVLVKWHNERKPNARTPMDNSLCDVIYECKTIDGTVIDNSFSSTAYGDSIYRTKPLNNISGFWFTLTNMAEGDSVTSVMPYMSAYGVVGSGQVKPYSTLIYTIKLKKIRSWEIPS